MKDLAVKQICFYIEKKRNMSKKYFKKCIVIYLEFYGNPLSGHFKLRFENLKFKLLCTNLCKID